MRVLVIGGTKFIGPYVVRMLVERGDDVTVFHRGENEPALPPKVRHIHDPRAAMPVTQIPDALLAPPPEIVIHMIAMGDADTRAAVAAFGRNAERIVWLSSGDVYRSYGQLIGTEPAVDKAPTGVTAGNAPALLTEDSPRRTVLYPYRKAHTAPGELAFYYDKILMENAAFENPEVRSVVLRLPKVYGPDGNQDLGTVYRYRHLVSWRWTHGYVENVAQAIVLAATHPAAVRRVYNVGEPYTPTIEERLRSLPPSNLEADHGPPFTDLHDIAYDTTRIRRELGYREPVSYEEGIRRTLTSHPQPAS